MFYRVDLNPRRSAGLFNQLLALTTALITGSKVEREIYCDRLYTTYDRDETIPLGSVIEVEALNASLKELGLKTKLHLEFAEVEWVKSSLYNPFWDFNKLSCTKIIAGLEAEKAPYIDPGNMFGPHIIGTQEYLEIYRLQTELIASLRFTPTYTSIADRLAPNDFPAVHLRIEDDSPLKDALVPLYLAEIRRVCRADEKIFFATDLLKNDHKYNHVLEELMKEYPQAFTSRGWRSSYPDVPTGREIDSLIDYLICIRSKRFIGYIISTFSRSVRNRIRKDGRPSSLLVDSKNKGAIPYLY